MEPLRFEVAEQGEALLGEVVTLRCGKRGPRRPRAARLRKIVDDLASESDRGLEFPS
jgi:hypothetical protein